MFFIVRASRSCGLAGFILISFSIQNCIEETFFVTFSREGEPNAVHKPAVPKNIWLFGLPTMRGDTAQTRPPRGQEKGRRLAAITARQ